MTKTWMLYRWKKYMWVIHDSARGHDDPTLQDPWMPSFYPLLDSSARRGVTIEVTFSDAAFEGWTVRLAKARDVKETIAEYHDQDGNVLWVQTRELAEHLGETPEQIYVRVR